MIYIVKIFSSEEEELNKHVISGKKPSEAQVQKLLKNYPNGEYAAIEERVYLPIPEEENN